MIETRASKSFAETPSERRHAAGRVPESTRRRRSLLPATGVSPLLWLNLLCLDAPIVALSWQWLFAKTFGLAPAAPNRWALFLTAWLVYLADRLGDSLALRSEMPRSLRQKFCLRHRNLWIFAIGLVAIADLVVIALWLDARTLSMGAALGLVAGAYLVVNHWSSSLWRVLPAKEVLIGLLFAGGVAVSLGLHFSPLAGRFALPWGLFACLCSLNCVCIARWECALDRAQSRSSLATAWPTLAREVFVAAMVLAGFAIGFAVFNRSALVVCVALSLSALGLAMLDRFGRRMQGDARTACADLVLLTPLAVMLT